MQLAKDSGFVTAMDRPIARGRFNAAVLGGAVLALAVAATSAWLTLSPTQRTMRVEKWKVSIGTATNAPFHDFIPLRGQVVPLDSIVLDAVQGGRVEQVLVEAGQRVSAGQPLIRLSDPSLELDAVARETQIIAQINAQRAQQLGFEQTRTSDMKAIAEADYNIGRLTRLIARREPLAAKGFVSRETLDQAADELVYQKRLRDLEIDAQRRDAAALKRSSDSIEETAVRLEANLAAVKRQLDSLTVRAPADGVLTGLDAHTGEEKTRGQHLGQIDRDAGFKVTVQVDEFYLARIKPGQRVAVSIDGTSNALVVSKIYPQVKDRRFEIDLAWQTAEPPGLRRGQAVQGKLELGDDVPAVVLPAGPFLEASGGAWAFVLDRAGTAATRRPIRLGRRTTEAVEVIEGLAPGEQVITSDCTGLDRIDRLDLSS